MEFITVSIIVFGVVVSLGIIYATIQLLRKKNVKVVVKPVPVAIPVQQKVNLTPPIQSLIPTVKDPDRILYEKFVKTYDSGALKFDTTPFRPGAKMTCEFGISEGFRYYVKGTDVLWDESMPLNKQDMRWGYVRPHMGVDRAGASPYTLKNGIVVRDPVICPFDFNRSQIVDFNGYSYGSLITLFNDEYQFEMSIAHMDPKHDFQPWSLNQLKNRGSFTKGTVLGTAGTYGFSSGAHTHTEFKSYDESCEVFDILLYELYGDKAVKEYTPTQIVSLYRKYSHFTNATEKEILLDWDSWKKNKKIIFSNIYKFTKIDVDGKVKSWYSSYLLFNKT